MSTITISGNEMILHLPHKCFKPVRTIGHINWRKKQLHVYRDGAKQYFRMFDGYGIAEAAIQWCLGRVTTVVYHIGSETYEITVDDILKWGRVIEFKKNHLEPQIFVSLSLLKGERPAEPQTTIEDDIDWYIPPEENNDDDIPESQQPDLFEGGVE